MLALEHMSRAQVQALCKERGIKANAKTSVLIQQLKSTTTTTAAAHPPRTQSKTLPPKSTRKAAVVARPNDELELDSASSEDDEMMLGPAPSRPTTTTTQPPHAVKKASVLSSSSGAPKAPGTVRKRVVSSSSTTLPSSSTGAVVYQTSPNTKATVAALLDSVKLLQSELANAKSALSTLQQRAPAPAPTRHSLVLAPLTRSPPSSPRLTRAQVCQIVDAKLGEHKEAINASLGPLRARMDGNDHWRDMVETSLIEVRQELSARLAGGRTSLGSQAQELSLEFEEQLPAEEDYVEDEVPAAELSVAHEAHSPVASTSNATPPPAQCEASPAYSDAPPPTASLASFSSPSASPRRASRRSSLIQPPPPAAPETPRRSARKSIVPAGSSTALALPPHMVLAASPRRSSGRRSSVSPAPAGLEGVPSPKSPARMREKLAIGKRTRGPSEASEVSVVAQRMAAARDATHEADEDADREQPSAFVSNRGEGHSRKRRRMSMGESLARARNISNESEEEEEVAPHVIEEAEDEELAEDGPEEVYEEQLEELVEEEEVEDVPEEVEEEERAEEDFEAELDFGDGQELEEAEELDAELEDAIEEEQIDAEVESAECSIIEHETALDLEPEVDEPQRFEDEADADLSSDDEPIANESLVASKLSSPAPVPAPSASSSSLSDPFYFASLAAPIAASRKSMPASALPFPLVAAFDPATPRTSRSVAGTPAAADAAAAAAAARRRTMSGRALLDATNSRLNSPAATGRKGSLPVTPMAAKTLYGTELIGEDRFDDFGGELVGGASTPGPKKAVWGGFF